MFVWWRMTNDDDMFLWWWQCNEILKKNQSDLHFSRQKLLFPNDILHQPIRSALLSRQKQLFPDDIQHQPIRSALRTSKTAVARWHTAATWQMEMQMQKTKCAEQGVSKVCRLCETMAKFWVHDLGGGRGSKPGYFATDSRPGLVRLHFYRSWSAKNHGASDNTRKKCPEHDHATLRHRP